MKDDLILEAINGLSRRIEKLDNKVEKLDNKVEKLDDKVEKLDQKIDTKIDNLEAKMEHKIGMLQAQLDDFKEETRENFRGVGRALNTAMEALEEHIKKVETENESEHQEFRKYLKIS